MNNQNINKASGNNVVNNKASGNNVVKNKALSNKALGNTASGNKVVNNTSANNDNNNTSRMNATAMKYPRDIGLAKKDLFKPIGILDPDGLEPNPLTGNPYTDDYKTYVPAWKGLPMYGKSKKAIQILYDHQCVLVISGTGSGKTVLTPKYLLHTMNYKGKIAITNPKKIPSQGSADFARKTLDVNLGAEVGVKFRGSNAKHFSESKSKLVYCTDGFILQKLYDDPLLLEYDAVIIDEAHERKVNIDILLLLLKDLLLKRSDFKLIIMSATINQKVFSDYFPVSTYKFGIFDAGETPNHPIEEHFLDKPVNVIQNGQLAVSRADIFLAPAIDQVVKIMKETTEGDILVFITGPGDGVTGCTMLNNKVKEANKANKTTMEKTLYCEVLHAGTDKETEELLVSGNKYKTMKHKQSLMNYTRKVIFATEVAESSLTINGIDFVIETGLANVSKYYSDRDMHALEKCYISKAAHKQRKGRTGRTRPGTCYNMFTEDEYKTLFQDFATAPIYLDDVSTDVLRFMAMGDKVSHVVLPFSYSTTLNKQIEQNIKQTTTSAGGSKSPANSLKITNSPLAKSPTKAKSPAKAPAKAKAIKNGSPNGSVVAVNTASLKPISLAKYLAKFIEPPKEEDIARALKRVYALGLYDVDGAKGHINALGVAVSKFQMKPEYGKMLVASYKYFCRDEMAELLAFIEISDGRIENIIKKPKPAKKNTPGGDKPKLDKYKKVLMKYKANDGDYISLLNIYKDFKIRKYDKTNRKTGNVLVEKKGDAKEWCTDNHLNFRMLERVKFESKDIHRKFNNIRDIHDIIDNPAFFNPDVNRSTKWEENVMRCLYDGLHINLAVNSGRAYNTCFPDVAAGVMIDQSSLYNLIQSKSKYILYGEYKSVFNNPKLGMIARASPQLIEDMKNNKYPVSVVDMCESKSLQPPRDNHQRHGQPRAKKWSKHSKRSHHGKKKSHGHRQR